MHAAACDPLGDLTRAQMGQRQGQSRFLTLAGNGLREVVQFIQA